MAKVDYTRLRILVVEDQDMIREIVVAILRALGCSGIRAAADGREALRLVGEDAPHLILCDITMQPMDGFQFVEELHKAGFTGAKRIPTIYLTAHSSVDFVQRAKQLGVNAYIAKPVKRAILEERIQQVLSSSA
jgi:two-component system, chemotaxis family, chemotaxis protein CheY